MLQIKIIELTIDVIFDIIFKILFMKLLIKKAEAGKYEKVCLLCM